MRPGKIIEEALQNLAEAVELYLDEVEERCSM
jgi:predicted RNase H-like HicB family nuclease